MANTSASMMAFLPLVGVLAGGLITFGTNYYLENKKQARESRRLAFAFQGEICALLAIIKRRQYVEGFQDVIDYMERTGQKKLIDIRIRREYFAVFKSNVGNIGLLACPLPELIAQFYVQANSVLEDIESHRDGSFDDLDVPSLVENVQNLCSLLQETIAVGEKIVQETGKLYTTE
jgi:hypothetical protein